MQHAPIFQEFTATQIEANGYSIYDFLGIETDVRFKEGWKKFAPQVGSKFTPPLPTLNEHYIDWVLTLESVARANGIYRMVELGAGWGTWAAVAATASQQRASINEIEIVAIEADVTHFDWMKRHFSSNRLNAPRTHLIHGVAGPDEGMVRFPVIDDPANDYGASMRQVHSGRAFVEVQSYPLNSILDKLSGPADFIHVDIQGAEYDIIPPAMETLKKRVKAMMIGTHTSLDKHNELAELFEGHGWREQMNYPRGQLCETPYGQIQFGDGLLAVSNPEF